MAAARETLGGLTHVRRGLRVPAMEAIPSELVGGANLVGEAECIDPALLFRPPTAVPCKVNHARLSTTLDNCCSHEIGAAGTGIHLNSIDHPFRMRVKQLGDEADDFDPRDGAHERDGRHIRARREGNDVALEAIGRAGARQDLSVDRHGRNISGDRDLLGTSSAVNTTKLTDRSAPERRRGFRQW